MACIDTATSCVTQGNDWYFNITITETGAIDAATGDPVDPKDITGSTIIFTLKETKDGAVIITPTVTINDAPNGQIAISLTAAQTETLITTEESRKLYGSPQITYADGTVDDLFTLELDVHKSWN